jgi:hypothetical protein
MSLSLSPYPPPSKLTTTTIRSCQSCTEPTRNALNRTTQTLRENPVKLIMYVVICYLTAPCYLTTLPYTAPPFTSPVWVLSMDMSHLFTISTRYMIGVVKIKLNLLGLNCQGTPAVVLMWASICASALNKGGSGDPGVRSIVSCTRTRTGGIRYIY